MQICVVKASPRGGAELGLSVYKQDLILFMAVAGVYLKNRFDIIELCSDLYPIVRIYHPTNPLKVNET